MLETAFPGPFGSVRLRFGLENDLFSESIWQSFNGYNCRIKQCTRFAAHTVSSPVRRYHWVRLLTRLTWHDLARPLKTASFRGLPRKYPFLFLQTLR